MEILSSPEIDVRFIKVVYSCNSNLIRFKRSLKAKPNAAHLALAEIYKPDVKSRVFPSAVSGPLHVTQNIDELSVRALKLLPESLSVDGLENLLQIHGSVFGTRCLSCNHVKHDYEPFIAESFKDLNDSNAFVDIPAEKLPKCGGDQWAGSNRYGKCGGLLRPDVVWFGEVPPLMGEVARKITWCDFLIVIGTSAVVSCKRSKVIYPSSFL